jgi:hypothetical protein
VLVHLGLLCNKHAGLCAKGQIHQELGWGRHLGQADPAPKARRAMCCRRTRTWSDWISALGDGQPGVAQVEAREVAHVLQVPVQALHLAPPTAASAAPDASSQRRASHSRAAAAGVRGEDGSRRGEGRLWERGGWWVVFGI